MPNQNALLLGIVRIDSTNNSLRVRTSGGDSTLTMTVGTYWLGLNNAGTPTDANVITGLTSFFDQWDADLFPGKLVLEYPDQTTTGVVSPGTGRTGHIWGTSKAKAAVPADKIYWSHADTTMDPAWLGVASTGGAVSDTTFDNTSGGDTYTDISDMSSSLAFVGGAQIRDDRAIEEHLVSQMKVDSGKVYTARYGTHSSRYLEFRASGLPRSDIDTDHHSMRRIIGEIGKGLGCYYFPDTAVSPGTALTVDDNTEANRWGYQRLVFSPRNGPVNWDDRPHFEGYYNHWVKGFFMDEYVA